MQTHTYYKPYNITWLRLYILLLRFILLTTAISHKRQGNMDADFAQSAYHNTILKKSIESYHECSSPILQSFRPTN